jgi:hypothetical protein
LKQLNLPAEGREVEVVEGISSLIPRIYKYFLISATNSPLVIGVPLILL